MAWSLLKVQQISKKLVAVVADEVGPLLLIIRRSRRDSLPSKSELLGRRIVDLEKTTCSGGQPFESHEEIADHAWCRTDYGDCD